MAILGDSSDREINLSKATLVQSWPIERWINFLKRNPDATLPGGVGGALVQHYEAELIKADEAIEKAKEHYL